MTFGFRRTRRGIEASFSAIEVEVLRDLAAEVAALVRAPDREDPVVSRLFPDAHRDDPSIAAAYRELVEDDLRGGKLAAARALGASLEQGGELVLDEADAEQWLSALNDIRLALGTRLGVTEQTFDEVAALEPDDPHTRALHVYEWLSVIEESLVDALGGGALSR